MSNQITIPGPVSQVSDGYHSFEELYAHRTALFAALANLIAAQNQAIAWKSKLHQDKTMYEGWFIAGLNLPTGNISYHLPISHWDMLNLPVLDCAPEWDGHTSIDVIRRIKEFAFGVSQHR